MIRSGTLPESHRPHRVTAWLAHRYQLQKLIDPQLLQEILSILLLCSQPAAYPEPL